MDCFIKKIFIGKIDGGVHKQFVRFGKGIYEKRALLSLQKNSKVKVRGSYEYANDFVELVAEFPVKFSGVILSKDKLNLANEKKKAGLYHYEICDVDSSKIKEIGNKAHYMLLDVNGKELELKIKKKLPKPGKSGGGKADDKFCQLEADFKYYPEIKSAFLWDAPECKKVKVGHTYLIESLEIPKDEEDFELIRIKTKRKGRIIRRLEIDKKEQVREKEFEV